MGFQQKIGPQLEVFNVRLVRKMLTKMYFLCLMLEKKLPYNENCILLCLCKTLSKMLIRNAFSI